MATVIQPTYGTYTAMTVTNLQSLASDSTDVYAGWQGARVDNFTTVKADDYHIIIDLSTAATAPAGASAAYVYIVPWSVAADGTTWTPGGNFGTTTAPAGTEGTANISEPNSMRGPIWLPYKITSQRLQKSFLLSELIAAMPGGWSPVIRNETGAALGTGCVVAYRPITYTAT